MSRAFGDRSGATRPDIGNETPRSPGGEKGRIRGCGPVATPGGGRGRRWPPAETAGEARPLCRLRRGADQKARGAQFATCDASAGGHRGRSPPEGREAARTREPQATPPAEPAGRERVRERRATDYGSEATSARPALREGNPGGGTRNGAKRRDRRRRGADPTEQSEGGGRAAEACEATGGPESFALPDRTNQPPKPCEHRSVN